MKLRMQHIKISTMVFLGIFLLYQHVWAAVSIPIYAIDSTSSVSEGEDATFTISVKTNQTNSSITLKLSESSTDGTDYENFVDAVTTAVAAETNVTIDGTPTTDEIALTFNKKFGDGDFVFSMQALDDAEVEDTETIIVTLSSTDSVTIDTATAITNITDSTTTTTSSSTTTTTAPTTTTTTAPTTTTTTAPTTTTTTAPTTTTTTAPTTTTTTVPTTTTTTAPTTTTTTTTTPTTPTTIPTPSTSDGDICVFNETADDVVPNIFILFDTGAGMEQIFWHQDYNNSTDYTPSWTGVDREEVVDPTTSAFAANGFYWENGYGIIQQGQDFYLVKELDNIELAGSSAGLKADTSDGDFGIWEINGKSVTLPAVPGGSNEKTDGVSDQAAHFRYSANYLNWIFFSGEYTGAGGDDFKALSRLYYAKKAMMTVGKKTANKARLGLWYLNSDPSQAQPIQSDYVKSFDDSVPKNPNNNVLDPAFVSGINGMKTPSTPYSPLAYGLAAVAGKYNSPSADALEYECQKNFVIVVSPGVSSDDQSADNSSNPKTFSDYDSDGEGTIKRGDETFNIPTKIDGTTYLDDVAHYLYTHDMITYQEDGKTAGMQNINTYTVGFMGDLESKLFLINTSNNGNGHPNLYDPNDPEYGKYHFEAQSPEGLADAIMKAINDILNRASSFTAPVVPVTRTTSGDRIYLSFFKPDVVNFWEGNVAKYGINTDMQLVDKNGDLATWPNGAMKDTAEPYWQTKNWATEGKSNYINNADREIYTWLNQNANWSASIRTDENAFTTANTSIDDLLLGNPFRTREEIINYIRGADAFDEDSDSDIAENRAIITGDVLHSEPTVVYYNDSVRVVFFGSNDGMLHAVADEDGTEKWAFIPPDVLHRLKDIIDGVGHQNYVDLSPKVYIKDANGDGNIEETDGDQAILVCGERKGGYVYFALDITDPDNPKFLWRISSFNDSFSGPGAAPDWKLPANAAPDYVIPEMGESWSEPQFGKVLTATPTIDPVTKNEVIDPTYIEDVMFIGGGYRSDNSSGNTVLIINVQTGEVLKQFNSAMDPVTGMDYSIAAQLAIVDENDNGYIDKLYVGDLGGQIWRFGKFYDYSSTNYSFPDSDENINNWTAHLLFKTETYRKFFYRPNVTLDEGFDAVFIGSGDRENSCDDGVIRDDNGTITGYEYNRVYMIKDVHSSKTLTDFDVTTGNDVDLVNITIETNPAPNLKSPPIGDEPDPQKADYETSEWNEIDVDNNDLADWGWYINLAGSEKVLAEGVLFAEVLYITTFTLNDDPCTPGGDGKLYAFDYLTAESVLDFDNDGTMERSVPLGGGIPSKPVLVIPESGDLKLFISVGSTLGDPNSLSTEAGIIALDPKEPGLNFFFRWWKDF
ncbi:PilC/PilY family type IV pilus protein [Desulfococcaceae bacterium HSG7]|nr:PilC/PilY family type IV pilus protein [Desulfococcaceae bacterium HSG7]